QTAAAAPQRQPAQTQRQPAQTQSASATTPTPRPIPQEAVTGVALNEPATPESVDLGNGLEAVRRERAGPDQ
ncbi:MAG TPA: hypothetical protein PLK37_16310, partial [Terricaulis sp.]|nr:hypothetical protein [Terricaulis sp.]